MISLPEKIRTAALRVAEWNEEAVKAWVDVSKEERNILSKYAKMFLDKLSEEDFPKSDKKILKKHVRAFVSFLEEVK